MKKNQRKLLIGAYATVITVAVIVAVILVNILLAHVESRHSLKLDLTQSQVLDLSPLTVQTLETTDEEIVIYYFVPNSSTYQTNKYVMIIDELLKKYAAEGKNISVEKLDPLVETGLTTKFLSNTTTTLSSDAFIVVANGDAKENDEVQFREPIDLNALIDQESGQIIAERIITGSILSFREDSMTNLWFLSGHGSLTHDVNGSVVNYLSATGFKVGQLTLPGQKDQLLKEDVLVIAGLTSDLETEEADIIKNFIDAGGDLIVMYNDYTEALPNFTALMAAYKIKTADYLIMDTGYPSTQLNAFVAQTTSHSIVEGLEDKVGLQVTRPVYIEDADAKTGEVAFGQYRGTASLLLASPQSTSYLKKMDATDLAYEPGDEMGPFKAGIAYELSVDGATTSRIAVYGSTSVYSLSASAGNYALFINTVNWVSDKEGLNIGGKAFTTETLNISDIGTVNAIVIVVVVILPLIILGLGIVIWIRRKHR